MSSGSAAGTRPSPEMDARPEFTLTLIPYYGGPYDGERTAMTDGVRAIAEGGYYEVEWKDGQRVAMWHQMDLAE
jgi:hypothetical protein